jgi:uncharacterized protein
MTNTSSPGKKTGQTTGAPPPAPRTLAMGLRVPMRDGVLLSARLYAPAGTGPWPTVFMLTPYLSSGLYERSKLFNAGGYACLAVDCRGRAESGGTFCADGPQVGRDGADVIAWIRAQPWSNGEVVMRGGSQVGNIQWQVLAECPEGLVAAAPFAAAKPGWDSERINGIVRLDHVQWLAHVHGRTANEEIYADDEGYWTDVFRAAHREHWSLQRLAGVLGSDSGIAEAVRPLVDHPGFDAYWEALDVSPQAYAHIDLPLLAMTGYYDGNQAGTLRRWKQHEALGTAGARARHFLVIGPWEHAGVMVETACTGGVDFGPASVIARVPLHLQFYDWARGRGPQPSLLRRRVSWFVAGLGCWRQADSLREVSDGRLCLQLGHALAASHAGLSQQIEHAPATLEIVADPFQPAATKQSAAQAEDWLVSPTYGLPGVADGHVWLSEPLPEPLEIAGIPRLHLELSADVPDFDLYAALWVVRPSGQVFFLTEALFRARWRRCESVPAPMVPGTVETCTLGGFGFFAHRLQAGERLRLCVRALDDLVWQRNLHTLADPALADVAQARVARIKIHVGRGSGSRLELPTTSTVHAAALPTWTPQLP